MLSDGSCRYVLEPGSQRRGFLSALQPVNLTCTAINPEYRFLPASRLCGRLAAGASAAV